MTLPALTWLRAYDRASLRADLVAGVTLAAYLLPAAIGDASLAGLPAEAGLYACLFGGLVFWLFCSSRHTTISVTSAISLLVGATIGTLAVGDPVRHATLATCTALMVAVIAFIAYALNAGSVVNFFSETVLAGFKCGLAFFLASTQLPKLFGFAGSHGDFWENAGQFLRNLNQTNATALAIGGTALVVLLLGKTIFKNRPVALVVLVGGILLASLAGLEQRGVKVIGEVPAGLPTPALPAVTRADVNALIPLAFACFLLAAVETSAIGRMFGAKHRYRLDATQEFLAIGGANLASGVMGGFPVSGGSSQSLVNESAGARTPISGLVAALLMLVVALFLTGLLRNLPQPVLAAIVLAAVTGLVDVHALRGIWRFSRAEFAVAAAAFLGVLGAGLLDGVLIGVVLSILLLIRRAAHPRVVEAGRVPGSDVWADRERHPEVEREPDVLVARAEGSLLYFNSDHVRRRVDELIAERDTPPRLVVFYMAMVPFIDLAGAELIEDLHATLGKRGIALRVAEVHGEVRHALGRAGSTKAPADRLMPIETRQTVEGVVRDWRTTSAAAT